MLMMKNLLFLFLSCCLLVACNSSKKQETTDKVGFAPKINEIGQRYLALERFSGVILVAQEDSVLFEGFYGMANQEKQQAFSSKTAFKVGTLSIDVTRFIINQMVINKSIDLEEKAATYLPQIKGDYTVNQLLNYETGLPNIATLKTLHSDVTYAPITFANLAITNPENSGPSDLANHILGKIIEVKHKSLDNALAMYLGDLGLENTYFVKENSEEATGYLIENKGEGLKAYPATPYNYAEAYSHSGLKTTARDLLKMSSIVFKTTSRNYAYLNDDAFSFMLMKEKNRTIIILSNRRHPIGDEIAESVQAIVEGKPYQLPLLRETVKIDPKLLHDYTGWYAINPNVKVEVITENDSLFVMMGPNKVALLPQSDHQFYMQNNDASMRFLRDSTGKVTRTALLNGFITTDQFAEKVEE